MENISFYHPENIIFASAIPVYLAIALLSEYISWHRLGKVATRKLLSKLVYGPSQTHKVIRVCVIVFILLFMTVLLMQPRWGDYYVETPQHNVNIVFVLDISLSMLARDVYPSRLEKAKTELVEIIHQLRSENAGLVLFSSAAFTHVPLTYDYPTLISFIENIESDMTTQQGTDITKAIRQALALLNTGKSNHKKLIFLVSDGETHHASIQDSIEEINQNNAVLYALGVGSDKGDQIPLPADNLYTFMPPAARHDSSPRYLHDRKGNIVTTQLNKRLLTELSFLTGGKVYFSTSAQLAGQDFYKHIKNLGTYTGNERISLTQADQFHYVAALLLVLLVGEFLLTRLPRQK